MNMKKAHHRVITPPAAFLVVCFIMVSPVCARGRSSRRKSGVLAAPAGGSCPGDLNLDRHRDVEDLDTLSQVLLGKKSLQGEALANADVDGDQKVDVADLGRLIQHLNGTLPMPKCEIFSPQQVACPGLALQQASGQPFDEIGVGHLPDDFKEPISALVMSEDGSVGAFTVVSVAQDGSARMVVPFYPGLKPQGGKVTVRLTDGFSACPAQDFTIEAMAPASGSFSQLVDALQQLVDSQAQQLGFTREELRTDHLEQLPRFLYPLVVAQSLLDDPDNPNSLRAFSQGSAPSLGGNTDLSMLDALVARIGLTDLVNGNSSAPAAERGVSSLGEVLSCIDIKTAEDLSTCMQAAIDAQESLKDPPEGSATAKIEEDASDSLTVLELMPVVGDVVGEIEDAIKTVKSLPPIAIALAVWKYAHEAEAKLLPSRLLSLDFDLSFPTIEEDRPSASWGPAPLTAVSKGWSVDPKKLVETLLKNALKNLHLNKFAKKWGKKASNRLIPDIPEGLDPRDNLGEKVGKLAATNATKQIVNFLTPDTSGAQIIVIDPQAFGPVDISDKNWSTSLLKGDTITLLDHSDYAPVKDGATDLIVRARTDGKRFGGVAAISKARTVEVEPIKIAILQDGAPVNKIIAKPGEHFSFTVKVEDAAFPDNLKAELVINGVEAPNQRVSLVLTPRGDTHTLNYMAPASTDGFPELIEVKDTATTGACQDPSGCGRTAVVEVGSKPRVLVTPFGQCVDPGQQPSISFTAQVLGIDDQRVTWTASAGMIDEKNGMFSPPNEPGTVTITATSQAFPDAMGTALIKVGGCSCYWIVQSEQGVISQAGDFGSFGVQNGSLTNITLGEGSGEGHFTAFGPITGQGGNFQTVVQGNIGVPPGSFGQYATTEDAGLASLVFTKNDPDVGVAGSVTGMVHLEDPTTGTMQIIPFSALFNIDAEVKTPGGVQCTVR